ncbi:hypothetical protein [Glaciimonas immobilis]|uniref:Putative nucleic acid-binding Zn-ribbon protein n=1 Tax=Glaciimonas immobilis TaxID=728004 RepID=A0A840RWJ8_9BURK|nr:hypothetical protein [Glaciimonas immobilis]KAF3998338.1 hypothetical protein HAV38_09055 [Glaciimonas immobilis]MBB5201963.1 putative nucleic acid-binding Zn-ribbon protein [Glaciimonas immobilis]
MNMLKRLFTPTHLSIVNDELIAARLQLLSAENDLEHVQAQVSLLNARIARLEGKLKTADAHSSMMDAQFYATRLRSAMPSETGNRSQQAEHDISELRPKLSGK